MPDPPEPPGSMGIEALTRKVDRLTSVVETLRHETVAGYRRLQGAVTDMPTRAEFDAAKAALGQAINDATTRITTDIQALRDQIAAGNPVTDQDLADLQDDTTKLGNLDPAVVLVPSK